MTNKYLRTIYGIDKDGKPGSLQVDVYNVLDAYPTKNPALDHLIKKALCPGQRGHKDLLTDLDDIIKSAQRAKELVVNQLACSPDATLSTEGPAVSPADQSVTSVKDGPASCEVRAVGQVKPSAPEVTMSTGDVERELSGLPARGYAYSFSHRPSSFDGHVVHIVEGINETTLASLEHEIAQVDTIPDYVLGPCYCPERSIVIRDNNAPHPADDGRWHFTVTQAIAVLIKDQKKVAAGPAAGRPTSFKGLKTIYAFPEKIRGRMPKLIEAVNGVCGLEYIEHIDDALAGSAVVGNYPPHEPMVDGRFTYGLAEALEILANDKKKDDTDA